ncbi:MAG: recombinase family protein [Bacilli bacterium]|nr:recombinase family protein [Bacilli bacterium]
MASKVFAYGRISSSSQGSEDTNRQIEAFKNLNICDRDIFFDVKSGKDFQREKYKLLKSILRENDVLVIKSIDRLGRNYNMILEEWRDITKNIKAHIKVIDMPILDTTQNDGLISDVINSIILTLLSFVAEQERTYIRSRQREGIDLYLKTGKTKTGNRMGRPTLPLPINWSEVYEKWNNKEITARKAMELLGGIKPNKFYTWVKEERS